MAHPQETVTRALRVLVVDDEPLIGETLRILLSDHDVTVATSGTAGQQSLGDGDFDVILCDLMLRDLSGMELSRWLEKERPELQDRMIFMTGGAFTEEASEFLSNLPAGRRLEKPFSSDEIQYLLGQFS